jgi:hypothetical protein
MLASTTSDILESPLSRYVLKVTISRGYAGSIVEYQDFVVLSLSLSFFFFLFSFLSLSFSLYISN